MNKSLVATPLGKLVESLLLENELLGFLFSSFIWTIRKKMLWNIAIVALSSSKGFALEMITSFVSRCPHGAHIFSDKEGHIFLKVIGRARGTIFFFTIFFHFFHLHHLGGEATFLAFKARLLVLLIP